MILSTIHHMNHRITISASISNVFEFISNVEKWPLIFDPCIHARFLVNTNSEQRFEISAFANGEIKSWISKRSVDFDKYYIHFFQEKSQAPIATMGGEWLLEQISSEQTLLVLTHFFQAVDNQSDSVEWIKNVTDKNSEAELSNIKKIAEVLTNFEEMYLCFEDSVFIQGDIKDVYNFIYQAQYWHERLPHVSRVELDEKVPNIQEMEMETRSSDGSTHITKSVRLCSPNQQIVYKQIQTPKLMRAHTGEWTFVETPNGVKATSQHKVLINEENIQSILGEDATLLDAKKYVQNALSTNSLRTLELAKDYVENTKQAVQ